MSAEPRHTELRWVPVAERPDLVASPVLAALQDLPSADRIQVAEIDPDIADTAALVAATGLPMDVMANCLVVAGRRGEVEKVAAALVLGTTRADVNTTVRKTLNVRKASFVPMDRAVERTGMEYGGMTPIGLPSDWPVLVDAAVAAADMVIIGSGLRRSKLRLAGEVAAGLPGAQVIEGLGR